MLTKTRVDDDPHIERDLLAVSRYVERELGRIFNASAASVVRYYDGPGTALLHIDDLTTLTSIAVDLANDNTYETAVASTDLYLRPANAALDGWPYTHLLLRPGNAVMATWGHLTQSVKVTGTWGWPAVPSAIKSGVIHLTGILRLESPRATERVPEGLDAAISTSREGQKIVRDLMNVYGRVKVLV